MNRWVWPGAVVGALAAITTAAALVPAQGVPEAALTAPAARLSLVCPAFTSVTATLRVAAVGAAGLRTAPLSTPNQSAESDRLVVQSNPAEPVRVSGLLPDPFGATTVVRAAEGPDRGLSAVGCAAPRTEHWFAGVDVSAQAQSEVVVVNLDGNPVSVDLGVHGAQGRVSAPRGVEVPGNTARTISLGGLPRAEGPLTVAVTSSDGRVAAFLRQRTWAGEVPLGADWLPPAQAPATELVVAGIAAGEGARTLVVGNPGERTATVGVSFLTDSGPIELTGLEQLEVPAGTTRTLRLGTGLDGQAGALRLTSTQPVVAGVNQDTGTARGRRDPAHATAGEPLPGDGIWPLPAGRSARTLLQLANPAEAEATVTLISTVGGRQGQPEAVTVPPGSTKTVELAAGPANVVRVQTEATGLRAALVSTARLGDVRGLTVLPLGTDQSGPAASQVVFDAHVGS